VIEPPDGLDANLRSTWAKLNARDFESCINPEFKPLVYTLGFFHAVIQERKKIRQNRLEYHVRLQRIRFRNIDQTIELLFRKKSWRQRWNEALGFIEITDRRGDVRRARVWQLGQAYPEHIPWRIPGWLRVWRPRTVLPLHQQTANQQIRHPQGWYHQRVPGVDLRKHPYQKPSDSVWVKHQRRNNLQC